MKHSGMNLKWTAAEQRSNDDAQMRREQHFNDDSIDTLKRQLSSDFAFFPSSKSSFSYVPNYFKPSSTSL